MSSTAPRPNPAPYQPPRPRRRRRPADITALAAGAAVLLAANMPWTTITTTWGESRSFGVFHIAGQMGWEVVAAGAITVILAALGLAGVRSTLAAHGVLVAGGYATYLGCVGYQAVRVRAARTDMIPAGVFAHPGAGTVVAVMAGTVAMAAGAAAVCQVDPRWPRVRRSDRAALLGGLMVAGSVLPPWVTWIDRDGQVTDGHVWWTEAWGAHGTVALLLGVAALAAVTVRVTRHRNRWLRVAPQLLGAVAVVQAVAGFYAVRTEWLLAALRIDSWLLTGVRDGLGDPGPGLVMLALGGVGLLLSGVVAIHDPADAE